MLANGSLVPWTSPARRAMRIAAAAPEVPWSDAVDSLLPNGGDARLRRDARYRGRTGVRKQVASRTCCTAPARATSTRPAGSDPDADLTGWHNLFAAGEPYDDASGNPLPAIADARDELTTHHSAYYIDSSRPPAPVLITSGWNDDLFPADEAIRYYNRTRSEHPGAAIALILAERRAPARAEPGSRLGLRARARAPVVPVLRARAWAARRRRACRRSRRPARRPTASGGPYSAPSYARLAPGEVRVNPPGDARRRSCRRPAARRSRTRSSRSRAREPAPRRPAPTSRAPRPTGPASSRAPSRCWARPRSSPTSTSPGRNSQIAARLLDVDPAGQPDADRPRPVASGDRRGRGAAGLPAACERLAVRGRPPGQAGVAAQGLALRPDLQRAAERDGVEHPAAAAGARDARSAGGLVQYPGAAGGSPGSRAGSRLPGPDVCAADGGDAPCARRS